MDEIMEIKHFARKGAYMDTTERFFLIYEESKRMIKTHFLIITSLKQFSIQTVI
jgi:hypothetical protein